MLARQQDSVPTKPHNAAARAVVWKHASQSAATTTINAATRTIASTLGVLVGIGSIELGLLQCLQGSQPTPGLIVSALGPGYSWTVWKQGGEGAFTLLPNFLASGIVASLIGVAMIVWALGHIESRQGHVPGSWGDVIFVGRGRLIPVAARRPSSRFWPWTMTAATVLFLAAVEIAIFGFIPGVVDQLRILHICWMILGVALGLYLVSICSGFAADVEALERARELTRGLFP